MPDEEPFGLGHPAGADHDDLVVGEVQSFDGVADGIAMPDDACHLAHRGAGLGHQGGGVALR